MFLLVPAYPGCPGSKAVKWSLLLLLLLVHLRLILHQYAKLVEIGRTIVEISRFFAFSSEM